MKSKRNKIQIRVEIIQKWSKHVNKIQRNITILKPKIKEEKSNTEKYKKMKKWIQIWVEEHQKYPKLSQYIHYKFYLKNLKIYKIYHNKSKYTSNDIKYGDYKEWWIWISFCWEFVFVCFFWKEFFCFNDWFILFWIVMFLFLYCFTLITVLTNFNRCLLLRVAKQEGRTMDLRPRKWGSLTSLLLIWRSKTTCLYSVVKAGSFWLLELLETRTPGWKHGVNHSRKVSFSIIYIIIINLCSL